MIGLCPSCGFNLAKDEPVARDGWVLDPRGSAWLNGEELPLSASRVMLLLTLAKEHPRWVRAEALLHRASDGEEANTIAVIICQMRRLFRELGVPSPIESRNPHAGGGYRWKVAA